MCTFPCVSAGSAVSIFGSRRMICMRSVPGSFDISVKLRLQLRWRVDSNLSRISCSWQGLHCVRLVSLDSFSGDNIRLTTHDLYANDL